MRAQCGAAATVSVFFICWALAGCADAFIASPQCTSPILLPALSSSSTCWHSSRGAIARRRAAIVVASHASNLRERGWTVLAEPIIDAGLISRAHSASQSLLARLLAEVESAGCHSTEQQYRFKELVHRQRNRWDLQIPASDPIWTQLCSAALEVVTPFISEAQGPAYSGIEPTQLGAVISRPDARVQRFHCDATHKMFEQAKADPAHRLYNVFMPLVDLSEDGDGTEFWAAPRLEESTRALARHFLAGPGEAPLDVAQISAPMCKAGGLIVFDYRTIHRGLENPAVGGRERPIAYVTCATGGARDSYNFPDTSIADTAPNIIKQFPFFNELDGRGRAQDALEYYTEIEGASAFDI